MSVEPTPRRQYRSRAERRAEIIDATLQLLAERGPRNWTVALLAQRVGVSEGTLFKHFANKDEILVESVVEQERRTRKWVEGLEVKGEGWPALRSCLEAILVHSVTVGGGPLVLLEQATRFPDSLRESLNETKLLLRRRVTGLLDGSPLAPVAQEVTEIGLAVVTRALFLWSGGDSRDPIESASAQFAVLDEAFEAMHSTT